MPGRLGRIRLYPVKGLDPVEVAEAEILPCGALAFDRRWALRDARGRLVSGKNHAAVHGIRACFDLAQAHVRLDGTPFSLVHDGPAIAQWFSARLGEPLEWIENPDGGFPDDMDSPGPTLVSTGSLEQVALWFGLSVEQVRLRFRANLEIGGVEPFWEDRLYGDCVRVGEAVFAAVNPCQRCVVPSRDPLTGVQDASFQKRFAELRRAHLPAFARATLFDHYYRFAVNTRIMAARAGLRLRLGEAVSAG
jgi:uncharacterized protein YcbX